MDSRIDKGYIVEEDFRRTITEERCALESKSRAVGEKD